MLKHKWSEHYPRGNWPVYTCTECNMQRTPKIEELQQATPPSWFEEETCKPRKPLTSDDIAWLTGTGRFSQG